MRTLLPFLILAPLLVATNCDPLLDDDDGEPLVIATSQGEVQRLSAGDELASSVWTADIDPSNAVSILAAGNDLFVASGQEVRAWDLESGDAVWDPPVSLATVAVALAGPGSGSVFVRTSDALVAFQVADGAEVWRLEGLDLGDPSDDALVYGSGSLFLGGDPIMRIDPGTGAVLDEAAGSPDISDLGVADGTLYAGTPTGVQAFSASSLAFQWEHETIDQVDNLVVGDISVFYSVLGGGVGAMTLSGNPTGSAEDGEVFSVLAISNNLLLAGRSDGTLFAFDETDVSEVWALLTRTEAAWDLAASDASVFYAVEGILDGLNLEDAAQLWIHNPGGEVVAVEAI